MKSKILSLLALLFVLTSTAQKGINYKALIKNNLGNVVANQNITIEFSILEGPEIGFLDPVYIETHTVTTDANGIVIANIGEGTPEAGYENDYETINWGSYFGSHFLKVQIDTGSGLTDMGTTEFKAVPFALYAENTNDTGLEIVNEGSGNGYRFIGRNPDFYGTIGDRAVDLSYSPASSTTRGATGDYAAALGYQTTASGYSSFASGVNTMASGTQSTALGAGTVASGHSSTALGIGTRAEAPNTTAIGLFNVGGGDPLQASENDPLFEVGNGNYVDGINDVRTNALTVLRNGTITAPSFEIEQIIEPKALITKEYADANYSGGGTGTSPTGLEALNEGNGTGWRLIGSNPDNFGDIGLNAVDLSVSLLADDAYGATGAHSFASGYLTKASGNFSTAIGVSSNASGSNSIALGDRAYAYGYRSFASGYFSNAEGESSVAIGEGTQAIGISSMAFGRGTYATGNYSLAAGYGNTANASNSVALGINTIASGVSSFAFGALSGASGSNAFAGGYESLASGDYSIALGNQTEANQISAVAIGSNTTASANFATALGANTTASGIASTAMGNLSEASGLYSIAMGTNTNATGDFSTAMGVGATAQGQYSFASGNLTNALGETSTAMGEQTEASGDYSTAIGYQTGANNNYATALGAQTTASGIGSTAFGYGTIASGSYSTALGFSTEATGSYSIALGSQSEAVGAISTAFGFGSVASGYNTTAFGYQTSATGGYSTAFGRDTQATNDYATAFGRDTQASGYASTAMGVGTIANDESMTIVGKYNTYIATPTNVLFQVGNGTSDSSRSDAFTVIGTGDAFLSGTLSQSSDRRLKQDIIALDYGLNEVLQLKPVSYHWKKNPGKRKSLGLIAQEVQPIISEIVHEAKDKDKTLSVSYIELIPVLINAIQEQQAIIEKQAQTIQNQETASAEQSQVLQALLKRVEALEKDKHNDNAVIASATKQSQQ